MSFIKSILNKHTLYFAVLFSVLIHGTVIFELPLIIYRHFVKVQYSEYEQTKLNEIDNTLLNLRNKIPAPKELIDKTKNARYKFEEMKDLLKGSNPLPAIESLKEYRSLQEKLSTHSKYTEEDLNVLKEALENLSNEIKQKAKERTLKEDPLFQRFIAKNKEELIAEKKEKMSSPLKINLIDFESFKERAENRKQNEECEAQFTYYGIGVGFHNGNNIEDRLDNGFFKVTDIAEGYGADEKGIQKGDVLLGAFDSSGYFYEGIDFIRDNTDYINKNMDILINRKGKSLRLSIPIQKICYKGK